MANVSRQADEDLSWGADGMIFPDGLTLPETMGGSWPFEDCNEIFFPNDALVNSETRQMMITEASCLVHGMVIIGNRPKQRMWAQELDMLVKSIVTGGNIYW